LVEVNALFVFGTLFVWDLEEIAEGDGRSPLC
jgi:hypothetical protein